MHSDKSRILTGFIKATFFHRTRHLENLFTHKNDTPPFSSKESVLFVCPFSTLALELKSIKTNVKYYGLIHFDKNIVDFFRWY